MGACSTSSASAAVPRAVTARKTMCPASLVKRFSHSLNHRNHQLISGVFLPGFYHFFLQQDGQSGYPVLVCRKEGCHGRNLVDTDSGWMGSAPDRDSSPAGCTHLNVTGLPARRVGEEIRSGGRESTLGGGRCPLRQRDFSGRCFPPWCSEESGHWSVSGWVPSVAPDR
jgi:hypothetical protein